LNIPTDVTGIYHGDNRKLIPYLPDSSVDCVITDPPYGIGYWSRSAVTAHGLKWVKPVANDASLTNALMLFSETLDLLEVKCKPEVDVYVFTRWDIVGAWIDLINACSWLNYKMMLVWSKGSPGMGDIDANWGCGHELVLYCKRGRRDVAYRRSSIIEVDKVHPSRAIHPTEKPVPLIEYFVEMSTKPGEVVLDPYSGSGSTTVAAQRAGRVGIGFEEDLQHFENSTGRLLQGSIEW
jgi:adenine-specific DNA-methyltransferase